LAILSIDISTNEPGLTFSSFLNDLSSEIILIIFSTSFLDWSFLFDLICFLISP